MRSSARLSKAPNLSRVVRGVIRDVALQLPEFSHIRASNILVVAGEARRRSHATIRPQHFATTHDRTSSTGLRRKPQVSFRGKRILYVITLRPMFFRTSTPEDRVRTILHELFHISRRFDGTLHAQRRHDRMGKRFKSRLEPLISTYLERIPPELIDALSIHGVVMVRQWLEKPVPSYSIGLRNRASRYRGRRVYDEHQTFLGPVMMLSRRR